jgi:hypothetical protein
MGDKVGRVALFGIPLQQTWSYENTGDFAPTYYLQTDAPLYYYSFTDAWIAMAYKSLTPSEQARFDPMITGFNPADMYAADHIKRVLKTFPGVFSGIGEFSIHKEFVSSKIPGKTASLTDPALDRILDVCAETGLLAILHNDIDMPFPKPGQEPWVVPQFRDLLLRHPDTKVIWAHAGVGRIVRPVKDQLGLMEKGLANPKLKNFTGNPTSIKADVIPIIQMLFIVSVVIHAVGDGILAGVLQDGRIANGMRHSFIMLLIGLVGTRLI